MAYNYLPGFDVSVRDGGLVVPRPDFQTGSLLIIGVQQTASSATQSVTPHWIGSQDAFEESYGKNLTGNPLFQAWKQATDAGCKDIRVLELCGADVDTQYANLHTIYNHLEDYIVDAVALVGIEGSATITNPVIGDGDADYSTLVPSALTDVEDEAAGVGDGTKKDFTLTHSPVAESGLAVKVDGIAATDYTINYNTGIITFATAPVATKNITVDYKYATRSITAQLAGYCTIVSSRVSQTLGFVALASAAATDLATIKTYISGLTTQIFNGLVSVIGGPKVRFTLSDGTSYLDSGVAAYAAHVVMLPAQSAPTNKVLPGAVALEYNLSPAQLDLLCGKNIVTFRTKAERIVVTDGVTTAGKTSDFTRLTTVRIVNEAVEAIRTVADPFIGEPNDLPQQNALTTAIRSALDAMVQAGALRAFRFNLSASLQDYIDGKMKVDAELVPAFELRRINTTIALRPSL